MHNLSVSKLLSPFNALQELFKTKWVKHIVNNAHITSFVLKLVKFTHQHVLEDGYVRTLDYRIMLSLNNVQKVIIALLIPLSLIKLRYFNLTICCPVLTDFIVQGEHKTFNRSMETFLHHKFVKMATFARKTFNIANLQMNLVQQHSLELTSV